MSRRWFREFGRECLKAISHAAGSAIVAIVATLSAKIVSVAVGYAVVVGAVEIIEETFKVELVNPTWKSYVFVAICTLVVSGVAFWLREIRRHWLYGWLEMGVGIGVASQAVRPADVLVRVLSIFAGVRITVDGIKRWRDFSTAQKQNERPA